ncbi:hemagglutinin repeat-containing protein [Herbaspirillum sp. LeCh32-8]|uniref:two-partner secretion domain-containing protein n=1 Tax=Herbaspirillum sp. LeCh32-8 TaxID=2821356 RepID=UPI001AEB68F5|nr:hemagglutinin repeat-containing protein [Herbaspirillum sp. LeCh32-8]MBP0597384.1 hemagglutinin repeat-containing protein [Herbaspirillum sp. LeCh32-8]
MNKGIYRVVFNKKTGDYTAVAETACIQGKGKHAGNAAPRVFAPRPFPDLFSLRFVRLAVGIAALFGSVTEVHAQVVAYRNAPANQQPTVLKTGNGVPLVNIQTPSAQGVSRNIYSQFDVDSKGVILNNARSNAPTTLGGWVQGNPWLATGTAKVIVNEVNSASPSYLRGYVEVAGDRAQVILANPSGLVINGGGFLNATRATLTTGTPSIVGGALDAYRVTGGMVTIDGTGLDTKSADYTDIMARAVQINGNIWANKLKISTGINAISVDHGTVTATTGPTGAAPGPFSIDVAQLAGMYAGQITLVGTEHGVGMNNAGAIGASAGDVVVTADGLLQNKGRITASQGITAKTAGLNNQGGQLQAGGNTTLALGAAQLNNTGGLIRSNGAVSITAASVNNSNTTGADLGIQGQSVTIAATDLSNKAGAIRANTDLTIAGTGGIDNTNGTLSAGQTLNVHDAHAAGAAKTQTVTNTGGTVIAGKQLSIDSAAVSGDGQVLSLGDLSLKVNADYANTGTTQADGNATITTTGKLSNSGKLSAGKTLLATATSIDNQAGGQIIARTNQLRATDSHTFTNRGLIDGSDTFIDSPTINNMGAGRIYGDHLALSGDTLNNLPETVNGVTSAPVIAARVRADLGFSTINNSDHALIYSAGDFATGNALNASHQAAGMGDVINNSSATIAADGNGTFSHKTVNNVNAHLETTVENSTGRRIVQYRLNGATEKIDADSVKLVNIGNGQIVTDWKQMGDEDNFRLQLPNGQTVREWTIYDGTEQIARTKVTKSDPGLINIGGNLRFNSQSVNNRNSQIIAGGDNTGSNVLGTKPVNNGITGTQVVTTTGVAKYTYIKSHSFSADDRRYDDRPYEGQSIQTSFVLDITPTDGTGAQQDRTLKNTPSAVSGSAGVVVRTSNPNITLPNSALFVPGNNRYLIATDPQFANYRSWLSSDFMLTQLSQDPNVVMKRLGDGFYEQLLVQQQIQKAIGQRYAGNYANNEAQYQALMTAGVQMAQTFHYELGVALTTEQMAMLTSDIVWLVKQTVTLADGSHQDVLVPQVYLRANRTQVTGEGTLIAGTNVNYQTADDILNNGTIAAKNTAVLSGNNINNLGGRVSGTDTVLQAQTDINNLGGQIDGDNSVTAAAGRDININSTSVSTANATTTGANIDSVASVSGKTLSITAGRDLSANAAVIDATGNATLSATRDIKLGTVKEGFTETIRWADDKGASNWVEALTGPNFADEANGAHGTKEVGVNRATLSVSREVATQLSGNNISINAGHDITTQGTQVTAAGALAAIAGHDLNIGTANASASARDEHQKSSSGILSGKTTQTDDASSYSRQMGSTFSGNTSVLTAGNNASINGSDVVSTQGTQITAAGDINIVAAADTSTESHYKKETTSGIFSGGGLGVTVGSKMQSNAQTRTTATASGSTVGATNGNVLLTAGQHYTQTASTVIAPQGNVSISGKQVDITAGINTEQNTQETKSKQQGVTVQITNPVVSAVQTVMSMQDAKQKTKNGRSKILADAASALAVANAAAQTSAAAPAGGIDLAASIGASSSQSTTVQNGTSAASSTVAAGGTTTITATGAGKDSNLAIVGSEVSGNNVNLKADNQINLLGQRNNNEEHSSNKSRSASVGFSVGSSGWRFNASASGSRGKGDGSDSDVTNTLVTANNQLAMASGGDTTIKGATASGKQVTANVGGDLNVESLQDSSQYKSQQQSLGGSISVGTGFSGSINASHSKVDGNYVSVIEQSGINAGDGGFQVNVNGNTDLKGGKIASTDKAVADNKNTFQTTSLTTSTIQNQSNYKAESQSFSVGGGYAGGNTSMNGGGLGVSNESGSAASTTTSGISGIAGDKAVRSDKDSSNALKKTWNGQQLNDDVTAQAQIMQVFGQQAGQAIGDYASKQLKKAIDSGDTEGINNWKEGGIYRVALHTLAGGLAGGVAGASGAGVSAASIADIGKLINQLDLPDGVKKGLIAAAGTAVGAAVGGASGAAAGFNQTVNNYLKHDEVEEKLKKKADCATSSNPAQCRSAVEAAYNQIGRDRQQRQCSDANSCRANRDEITADLQTTSSRQAELDRKLYQGKLSPEENQEYFANGQQIQLMQSALQEANRQIRAVVPMSQWTTAERDQTFTDAMTAVGGLGAAGAAGSVKVPRANSAANFASDDLLVGHFNKHGMEFRTNSSQEYLQVGRDIMQNGQKVTYFYEPANEIRTGYISFMRNSSKTGESLFGFVGTNTDGAITTIHVKPRTELFDLLGDGAQSQLKAFRTNTVGPAPQQGWKYPYNKP